MQVVIKNESGMTIDRNFFTELKGFSSEFLTYAVERLHTRIEAQTGLFLLNPLNEQNTSSNLKILVKTQVDTKIQRYKEDEKYTLNVSTNQALLTANSPYGALRGIETFLQLLTNVPNCSQVPAVYVVDEPRFPWRGLMLDSVRHFIPIEDVKRQLDGMASAKLNTFHWHLTDDQGWRFESKSYPKLQEVVLLNDTCEHISRRACIVLNT